MTKKILSVCVFCGSSVRVDGKYLALAREAGRKMAENKLRLVYGGSRIGMMGALADATMAAGGKAVGVIPRFLQDLEVAHTGLDALQITETMHERQIGMAEQSDAFLMMPGGLGTLAEFFEVLTWKQLALHTKPIAVLNMHGYWDGLFAFMRHAGEEKFMRRGEQNLFQILESPEDLERFFRKVAKTR